jgi:hypothetical protein
MIAPRMSLSVFFLAQPQNGEALQLDILPTLSAVADKVIE